MKSSHLSRRLRRTSRVGFSLTELLLAATLFFMTLAAALSITSVTLRAADKTTTDNGLTGSSRLAMDEVLYQVRGADTVLASANVGGTDYTTTTGRIVLAAPGYDPASPAFYLTGTKDYVVIRYDNETKSLLETLVPGPGSVRPSRRDYVLASNVSGCTFQFRARESFTSGATGSVRFDLSATPTSTPTVYVNGSLAVSTYSSVSRSVTVSLTARTSDIQVVYPVDPAAGTTTLAMVGEVGIVLDMRGKGQLQIERNSSLQGAARLRNWRK